MAKIQLHQLSSAIQEAVKGVHAQVPHELIMGFIAPKESIAVKETEAAAGTFDRLLIMGFIAPEGISQQQANTIAQHVTQKVAPGAHVFVGAAPAPAEHAATALKPGGRLMGFRPSPEILKQ